MKTIIAITGLLLAFTFCAEAQSGNEKELARVEKIRGLYVFTSSKPVAEYEFLGTITKTNWSTYDKNLEGAIQNALKEYPKADGIIIRFKDNGSIIGDCIKFK